MRKARLVLTMMALLSSHQVFADNDMMSDKDGKSCEQIAKACLSGGYVKHGATGKRFWHDCMKPVLLGQSVNGVTVDAGVAKDCREHKISKMKKESTELENVMQKGKATN